MSARTKHKIKGKPGQNIYPDFVVEHKNSIYYGKQGEKRHGHTVLGKAGNIEYARTRRGRHVK